MKKAYSYIRFSTPEQKKGDSLRRQIEASKKWCAENDCILDDQMMDEGLSAWSGAHRTKGALGRFLQLVEAGKIEKGSVLIVESMDRLSREQVVYALQQFIGIITAGITLVTLMDQKTFTEDSFNNNAFDLMYSIMAMALANRESEQKSKRLRETWENKRANIGTKKLTKMCPAWLKRSRDWKRFKPIPHRIEIINKIFQMKLEGKSARAIAIKLNETPKIWKPKTKNGPGGWRKSYIEKILRNRAVIGEYQPHKMVDGKREPVGEPVKDYFPQIVDPDIFNAVQNQIQENAKNFHGGRTGKVSNLFSHRAKCGYCGGAMHHVNKGKPPKGYSYLVCDNAKRKNGGCKYVSWRYDELEPDILHFISHDLDVAEMLPNHEQIESELSELNLKRQSLKGQITTINTEVENYTNRIGKTDDDRIQAKYENTVSGLLDKLEHLESKLGTVEYKIDDLKKVSTTFKERIKKMRELMKYMEDAEPDHLINIRLKLRDTLRNTLGQITLYPNGFRDREHIAELETGKKKAAVMAEGIGNKKFKLYKLHLKTGTRIWRAWWPDKVGQRLAEIDRQQGFLPMESFKPVTKAPVNVKIPQHGGSKWWLQIGDKVYSSKEAERFLAKKG